MTVLDELRTRVARLERRQLRPCGVVPFGVAAIDAALPEGGLARGALHEVAGRGSGIEYAAAAAALVAGIAARLAGPVLWVMERHDLFAPALAGVGLHPDRVIYAEAGKPASVLLVMEEGLRHRGLAAVVGEFSGRLDLTSSRRLQLAAEQSAVIAFAVRRSRRHDDPALAEPNAAATRWCVGPVPGEAALPWRPEVPGLGRARWRLALRRCRGGQTGEWIVEACDAAGRLGLAADLADGSSAPAHGAGGRRRAAVG